MKSLGGRYDIGLDGAPAAGWTALNMLGQAVPEARVSNQKYIIPLGN